MLMRMLHGLAEKMPKAPCCVFGRCLCDEKGEDMDSALSNAHIQAPGLVAQLISNFLALDRLSLQLLCDDGAPLNPRTAHPHPHTGSWTGGPASGRLPCARPPVLEAPG